MSLSKQFIYKFFNTKTAPCVFLLLLFIVPVMTTLSDYGITYDEPIYMEASRSIGKWLSLEPRKIFDQNKIDIHWNTDPKRNIHPSGLKWFYLGAQKAIFWEKDPYIQNRVLNIFLLAVSLLVFFLWWGEGSVFRGAVFLLLLLTIPRFFAHTHFAATDIPMTSFLLLFLVCLDKTFFKKIFWITGIVLGIFISIKITSALLALPALLVFIAWHRREWKTVLLRIMLICLVGLLVFYALNPDWWFSPLSKCREFLTQSLTRRSWTPFTVYFAGQLYPYRGPFYYPFTMFLITTPLLHILLLFSGIACFFVEKRLRGDLKMGLIFICFISPFVIMVLPISPTNDGVRYLLPAFPFAAFFMTRGLERLWKFVRRPFTNSPVKQTSRWIAATLALILLALDLNSPAWYPPFELSYYNKIVGGLSGACRRGYETTYWGEILNNKVLEKLNNLCAGASVYFPLAPADSYFGHLLNNRQISFRPVVNHRDEKFMLIFGRPFVKFWESKTRPIYRQEGKFPVPIWNISIDSVPLIQLYSIKKID